MDASSSAVGQVSMIGQTIGGKFFLRELIGSGGMGKVYRADHKGVGRNVAVKIMHPYLLGDETAAARFSNEARAASQLNHPHSISVLDFGQTETGVLFIVMEFLRGRPLDAVLREDHPLALQRIAYMMCQAMEAVEAAHRLNIIHRDLKPENIFLLARKSSLDFVKVLDFGIAKMLDLEDRSVTTPGLVPGTPEYMSPEQARGEPLDPRSDVYSLGVIFYELLTNSVPFRGKSAVATMMAHVQDPPDAPSQRAPGREIPAALEAIVLWALAKDPANRISSARHFRDVVSAWAEVSGLWPRDDPHASSPNVLLEFFSEDQLSEFRAQVSEESLEGSGPPTSSGVVPVPAPLASTPITGREAQLARLQAFVDGGPPGTLRIEGEVGIGKARLITELVDLAQHAEFEVFRCRPDAGWIPALLGAAQRTVQFCLGLDERAQSAERLLASAAERGLPADDLPGFKELFGLPSPLSELDPVSRKRERVAAFRQVVGLFAAKRPLLLIFEDLDDFDEPSRELVTALAAAPAPQLALVITHSPDQNQLWPSGVESLDVPSLDEAGSKLLLHALFGAEIAAELEEGMMTACAGHPLFMEQLAFAMRYEQLTRPPDSLADLIASRIDALDQSQRRLVQTLAVIREAASIEDLQVATSARINLGDLEHLVDWGYLQPTGNGYAFVHDRLAVAAYASIPAEVRREIHQSVAQMMRARRAPVAVVAYHAYLGDDGPLAVEELDRAGAHALALLDHLGAMRAYSRALDLVRREWGRGRVSAAALDQIAVDLARRLSEVLKQSGDLLAAQGVLEEVLSVAAGQDSARARLRLDLGRLDLQRGNPQRAQRHLQLARLDAETAHVEGLLSEVLRELSRARGLMRDREQAARLLQESLDLGWRAGGGDGEPVWSMLLQAATIAAQIGFPDRAGGYLLEALQQAERERSLVGKLKVVARMASTHLSCSEWSEAEASIGQGIELAGRVGDRTLMASLLTDLARVRRIAADVEGARQYLEQAAELGRRIGWREGLKRVEQETELLRYVAPQTL
jgi:serine/threonine-protein kinase